MTEHTYPLELLRAELKSAMAEQLVQLVDRFASKNELAAFRADFIQHTREDDERFASIDHKLDLLIGEKNERDGVQKERATISTWRAVWIGAFAALAGSVITAAATLAAVAWLS